MIPKVKMKDGNPKSNNYNLRLQLKIKNMASNRKR